MTSAPFANLKSLPLDDYKTLVLPESPVVQEVEAAMDAHAALVGPRKHTGKGRRRRYLDLREQAAVVALLERLPAPDETFYCVCDGSFSLWNVVPSILKLAAPATIAELTIATLSFSRSNIEEMCAMLDTRTVGKLTLLVSGYFKATSPEIYRDAHTGLIARGQTFSARRNHAKILCIALSDGRRVTIHGSNNLRSCRNFENFAVEGDSAVYSFYKTAIDELIGREGI